MPSSLSRRWHLRQLIAASSLILLVACAEKPTAADAQPLQTLQPAPVVAPAVVAPLAVDNLDIQHLQKLLQYAKLHLFL
jgi:membrane-bound lytic murein transglycosylase B